MNRKFLIINKLFLSMFVMAIFLWLGFVGAIYPSYEDSDDCWQIPNYSSYSDDWGSYVTNGTYILNWYVNNQSAILRAAAGLWSVDGVCDDYPSLEWLAIRTDWKKNLCNSAPDDLKSHQQELFTYYASEIDYNFTWWFVDKESVWWLQNLMKEAGCHAHRDCKLWVVTISDFLFCDVCKAINNERESTTSTNPEDCPEWFVPVEWVDCCQRGPTECLTPFITINWELDKTTYNEEDWDLNIVVDYSDNEIWDITFADENKIVIEPTSALNSDINFNTGEKKILFSLSTDWVDNISINVENWCAVLEGNNCPPVTANLDRDIPCQLTKDRSQCDNIIWIDPQPDTGFTGFSSLLVDWVICEKWILELPFCPDMCLNWQITSQTCEQTYGSWWYANNKTPTCCINCGWDKIYDPEKDECVCDPNKTCNKSWYVVDPVTCKCKCDPSKRCCGIELNTVVPFIWDCIEMTSQNNTMDPNDPNTSRVNQLNAFPFLMMGLSKILVTAILIFSFLIVIAAWVMMVTWVANESNFTEWKKWIKNVVVALILLGTSGLILKLINPSFFGG